MESLQKIKRKLEKVQAEFEASYDESDLVAKD